MDWYLKVSFQCEGNTYLHGPTLKKKKELLYIIFICYSLEICLQIITAPHVLIRDAFVTNSILKVFLDGIVGQVDASTDEKKKKYKSELR